MSSQFNNNENNHKLFRPEGLVKNLVRADDQSEHSAALKDADRFLDASAEQEKHHKRRQKPAPRDNTGNTGTQVYKFSYC